MAIDPSQSASRSASSSRLVNQAAIRFAKTMSRAGWPDYVFAFHDHEEIGPRMLARVAKQTGLKPEDL